MTAKGENEEAIENTDSKIRGETIVITKLSTDDKLNNKTKVVIKRKTTSAPTTTSLDDKAKVFYLITFKTFKTFR